MLWLEHACGNATKEEALKLRRLIAPYVVAGLLLATLVPATPSFADGSSVSMTIVAQPITRTNWNVIYDPLIGGDVVVVTTTTITQLP